MRTSSRFVRLITLAASLGALSLPTLGALVADQLPPPPPPPPPSVSGQLGEKPEPAPVATGFILGRIVNAGTTTPIADAVVTISGAALGPSASVFNSGVSGGPRRVATDAQGQFLFRDLPKGTFMLSAAAPGYGPGAYGQTAPRSPIARTLDITRSIALEEGERLGDVTIELWRDGSISGTVRDEAGEPIVGTAVSVMARMATWSGPAMSGRTTISTDDRGAYRADVTPGDYVVSVVSTPTTVPAASLDEYQQAQSGGPAASRAYSDNLAASGAPFPGSSGIRVGDLIVNLGSFGRGGRSAGPPPSQDGRLYLYPTTYYVNARTASAATVVTVGSGEQKAGVDLQLIPQPTFRVAGSVSGPAGPMSGVGVRLIIADGADLASPAVTADAPHTMADAAGNFTFLGIVPGQYVLRVVKQPVAVRGPSTSISVTTPGGGMSMTTTSGPAQVSKEPILWATMPVVVSDKDVLDLPVSLRTGARFTGHLEFSGAVQPPSPERLSSITVTARPVPGTQAALVTLTSMGPGRADERGQFFTPQQSPGKYLFTIGGVPPGWALRSVMIGGIDASDQFVELGATDIADVVISLTDRVSKVGGTVRGADGKAAAAATIVIIPSDMSLWSRVGLGSRRQRTLAPGRDGSYSVSGLPSGEYLIAAVAGGGTPQDFTDPKVLTALMGLATRILIGDGDVKTQDLRVVELRVR